jgi:hypothetical protein
MRMNPEVREFIKHAGLSRANVEHVAAMLPDDDLELDNWIAELIRENESMGLHLIIFAALSRERPVDARHLASGAKLVGAALYTAAIAFRVQGEMPEYLLEGLRNTAVYHAAHAMALLAIAVWCDERRGGVYPDQLIPEARKLARTVTHVLEVDAYLIEVTLRTKDSQLDKLIREHHGKGIDAGWEKVVEEGHKVSEREIAKARGPLSGVLPEEPLYSGSSGAATVRRSVPRIGRNEPCHCGSGKKYKHCCYEKDRERLQQSSEVAGLTQKELREDPERHLTLERLEKKSSIEIVRMDPTAIPRHLMAQYFIRLAMVDLDRAAANLERLGYEDDLEDSWFITMFTAVRTGRKDIGDRLMELRRPFGLTEEELRLSQRLLLARDEPAKWIRLVEAAALEGLKTENSEKLLELAFAVAHTDATALGLILYRGVLPLVPPKEIGQTYDQIILPIRERLNLPLDDPLKDALENRTIDAELALREAEAKFEAKRREVRALRESIDQFQKEVARREREPAPLSPDSPMASEDNEQKVRQLREKVKHLESDLKERHNERNVLQRRLEKMQARFDSLLEQSQANRAESSGDDEIEREEELLQAQETEENHPLRLIEFPRSFLERLGEFPHHVARSAMAVLGRLAGGDPGAFSGAKRLKSAPTVVRQRVGIDFRLLFRLLPDRIQVIDLIPRQDLERKIKTLR